MLSSATNKKKEVMKTEKVAGAETQIRQQIDNFVKAFHSKDVDLMMSLFSSQMV
jgi:hypothetical protein